MEPKRQAEIQLGHMCNNRCVFCVSGQQTELRRARPLAVDPILERVSEARARGNTKLTILGGEPTLQPGFKAVVQHAVKLGFEDIVVFTNGVKTARESFIDEVLELGDGRLTWRISIQGANKHTHERTTRRPGSFDRIVQSMQHLANKGERITVNMCVVQSNYESVDEFPELLTRFGARQLHLDMVRPMDAGERTAEEFAQMIPRYSDMVEPLKRMIAGFDPSFDVNVGNLPYCIAPEIAHRIHHDGEQTDTIAVDGDNDLSRPWNKYFVKRRDKGKPERCEQCVFEPRCNGVFDMYVGLYGTDELQPVSAEQLLELDPQRRSMWAHLTPAVRLLREADVPAPFERITAAAASDHSARVALRSPAGTIVLGLVAPGSGAGSFERFALVVERSEAPRELTVRALRTVWQLLRPIGGRQLHAPGDDALQGGLTPPLTARVARLRAAAPFGELHWTRTSSDRPESLRIELEAPDGASATVKLDDDAGKVRGGYDLHGEPSPALVEGLRALMGALRSSGATPARAEAPAP